MKHGICKLCLNKKELHNSHIIPDFVFRYIRKSDRQLIAYREPNKVVLFKNDSFSEYLLCTECEKQIKIFEDYVRQFLFDIFNMPIIIIEEPGVTRYSKLKFNLFKKYLLSVLWRASVSNNKFYSKIDLGTEDNELLRQILYSSEDITYDIFPCKLVQIYDDDLEARNLKIDYRSILLQPFQYKEKEIIFVYAGLVWSYYKNFDATRSIFNGVLSKDGDLVVPKETMKEHPYLFDFIFEAVSKSKKKGKFSQL
ncbi:MAG: hypothetical protein GF353_21780 [Candidatus Lokiarchaeota archaeon]|nr:hypothetical protein [Candidatus Lokiarchaeota archaeon]